MFASIRNRTIIIALLVVGSIFALVPRSITLRERDPQTGVMRDTVVTQVPIKRALDLQGGMHLALELDQSKQVSSDPKRDIELALTVLRKGIEEVGVLGAVLKEARDYPKGGG